MNEPIPTTDVLEPVPATSSLADLSCGKPLDIAVAKNVMGWSVRTLRHVDILGRASHEWIANYFIPPEQTFLPSKEGFQEIEFDPLADDCRGECPPYSTDHNAAAQVLVKMADLGVSYTLGNEVHGDCRPFCYFGGSYARKAEWRTTAQTLPEAICRAALTAVHEWKRHDEQVNNRIVAPLGGNE